MTEAGLQYKIDESGASIGRRYARADELGIPYALTFDFDTIGKGEGGAFPKDSITLRERDSSEQVRLPLAEAAGGRYLPYISPISLMYLPYISPISPP